jgi:multimeric flavodoxin WrbA
MRIVTILGSPRRKGNTATVLGWIEDRIQTSGHEVERIDIIDYSVGGCLECKACKRGHIELCGVADDANDVFRRMTAADAVLFAAPVFCWGFPAQLKGLIDRLYCLMDFDGRRTDAPRLYGKPLALLLTADGDRIDNADMVFRGFQYAIKLLFARPAGELLIPNCNEPDSLDDDAKKKAVAFADELVGFVGKK